MLKNREANPLAVFNMRKLEHCPPHFQKLIFKLETNERDILDWIFENTAGRFYLMTDINSNTCVAFEIHNEATYFTLFLSQINAPKEYL